MSLLAAAAAIATIVAEIAVQPSAPDWREAERGRLSGHVQLTFPDRFLKAGESYFSPDASMIIFQAVEAVKPGDAAPEDFYGMYVGDVVRDDQDRGRDRGRISGLTNFRRLSPVGSANTCGWFHPLEPGVVIFGSTITSPTAQSAPGYQRGTGRYKWMFPPEMDIVTAHLDRADGTAATLERLVADPAAYIAECSYSGDGRHLLFNSLQANQGDLFTIDTKTGVRTHLVSAPGYDGGPFFSPDGKRICYRSDRRGNNLLQIFIGDLEFDDAGTITGLKREYQLTDNASVNWAPYWHPDGRHLLYTTSEISHQNYEVFIIDADPGDLSGRPGPVKYGTRKRRITVADGFDGLPVFDAAGKTMLWTSQRGSDRSSQLWVADFVLDIDAAPVETEPPTHAEQPGASEITVTDPETGLIYLYNPRTHSLTAYNPLTHAVREVTDAEEQAKAMRLFEAAGK